jgi:IS66 C-terminal element/Transposase IS66 family
VAPRKACVDQPKGQAGRCHPLCALALGELTRFIDDGRIELDNNAVERSIRPITLNRKNALFAGSDGGAEHWAIIASLVQTCKLSDVDPLAYLTDAFTRIVNGHPNSNIDELLPWAYCCHALKSCGLRTTFTIVLRGRGDLEPRMLAPGFLRAEADAHTCPWSSTRVNCPRVLCRHACIKPANPSLIVFAGSMPLV